MLATYVGSAPHPWSPRPPTPHQNQRIKVKNTTWKAHEEITLSCPVLIVQAFFPFTVKMCGGPEVPATSRL